MRFDSIEFQRTSDLEGQGSKKVSAQKICTRPSKEFQDILGKGKHREILEGLTEVD